MEWSSSDETTASGVNAGQDAGLPSGADEAPDEAKGFSSSAPLAALP